MNSYPSFEYCPPTPQIGEPQPPSAAAAVPISRSASTRSNASSSIARSPASFQSNHSRHHPYSDAGASSLKTRSYRGLSDLSGTEGEEDDYGLSSASASGYSSTGSMEGDTMSRSSSTNNVAFPFHLELDAPVEPFPRPTTPLALTSAAPAPPQPKPKTSHSRKVAADHIKRPPNAFILFRSHCCHPESSGAPLDAPGTPTAIQLSDLNITDHRHISRIASILWGKLNKADKAYWEKRAKDKKDEHKRLYPDYKYKPIFRDQKDIRRRKTHDEETQAEKAACEDVAHALLDRKAYDDRLAGRVVEPDSPSDSEDDRSPGVGTKVQNPPEPKWTPMAYVNAVAKGKVTLPPPSPKRGAKGKAASATKAKVVRKKEASQPEHLPLPLHPLDRPHTAPTGDHQHRFVVGGGDGRGPERFQQQDNSSESGLFEYMSQLDAVHQQQALHPGPLLHHLSQPPPLLHPPSSYDLGTNVAQRAQHDVYSLPPNSSHGVPYNPTFFDRPDTSLAVQLGQDPHSGSLTPISYAPTPIETPRPRSARSDAIANFNNYTLSSSIPPPASSQSSIASSAPHDPRIAVSPTSSTFSYTDVGPGAPANAVGFTPSPSQHHGFSNNAIPLSLTAMKRRGTLGRTALGGDLMLISPTTSAFNGGRKCSLGRWEVRNFTMEGEQLPTQPEEDVAMSSLDFNLHFMHSMYGQEQPSASAMSSRQASDQGFGSLPDGGVGALGARPDTGCSDFSSSGEIEREQGQLGQFWRVPERKEGEAEAPYHVGNSEYFAHPGPALPTSQHHFDPTNNGSPITFDYSMFGSFAHTFPGSGTHRPSIDAPLAQTTETLRASTYSSDGPDITSEAWANRAGRGSDATIRFLRPEDEQPFKVHALPATKEAALEALKRAREGQKRAREGQEEGGEAPYIYLTQELSQDEGLIEEILAAEVGVTYDVPVGERAEALRHHDPYTQPHTRPGHLEIHARPQTAPSISY